MGMPAFDMEPSSKSVPPDGNPAAPSQGDAAVTPPASTEAPAAKPATGGTAPTKPPAASLTTIVSKSKPAPSAKAGDLTRLFELARRQASFPPLEPVPATEPAPIATEPAVLDSPSEPQPMPIETAVAEVAPEPETAPEWPPVEPVGFVEAAPVAAPPTLSPFVAADLVDDTAEPLSVVLAPADDAWAAPESPHVAADVVESPASPAPTLQIESAAQPAPELSYAPDPVSPVALTPVESRPVPAPKFVELADYWRSLRRGDDHPTAESIDHDFVTMRWPGSLLIAYTPASQDPRGEPRPGRVTRLGAAGADTQNAVDAGSHSTEWMLEVARTALVNDEPVEEQQRLATLTGEASFRMVALPLGPPKGHPNAVLCMLLPSSGAPRFGKRRTWL
jgi:hypothetical protein